MLFTCKYSNNDDYDSDDYDYENKDDYDQNCDDDDNYYFHYGDDNEGGRDDYEVDYTHFLIRNSAKGLVLKAPYFRTSFYQILVSKVP